MGIQPGSFKLRPIATDKVLLELRSLCPQKATGLDSIEPRFLKDGAELLAPIIQHIINYQ